MSPRHNELRAITTPNSIIEPEWTSIRSIVVYGIPKSRTIIVLQWEIIECINTETHPVDMNDVREYLFHIMGNRNYDSKYYVSSIHYALYTDNVPDEETRVFTVHNLVHQKLHPTPSFERVCHSYFEAIKLLEIKGHSIV